MRAHLVGQYLSFERSVELSTYNKQLGDLGEGCDVMWRNRFACAHARMPRLCLRLLAHICFLFRGGVANLGIGHTWPYLSALLEIRSSDVVMSFDVPCVLSPFPHPRIPAHCQQVPRMPRVPLYFPILVYSTRRAIVVGSCCYCCKERGACLGVFRAQKNLTLL